MRWTSGDRSNIEDLRGRHGGKAIPLGIGGVLLLGLLSLVTGTDLLTPFTEGGGTPDSAATSGAVATSPEEEKLVDFVDATMADVQATWKALENQYQPTRAVLFRDAIDSACGFAQSATGPFYCPADSKVFLDLGFFEDLQRKLGAPGTSPRLTCSRTRSATMSSI